MQNAQPLNGMLEAVTDDDFAAEKITDENERKSDFFQKVHPPVDFKEKKKFRPERVKYTQIKGRGGSRVEQGEQRHRVALGVELAGNFVGEQRAETMSADLIRALRLDGPHLLDERSGQLGDMNDGRICFRAVEPMGLQPIKRLVGAEEGGERAKNDDIARTSGDAEKRRTVSFALKWLHLADG